jgi:putative spermidine/putrescine transport system substrate-binding protein
MTMEKQSPRGVSRRTLLLTGAAGIAAPAIWPAAGRANQAITVTCWGGAYRKGIEDCYAAPFTKETGIAVTLIDNADLARMKAQVDSRNVQWDVFDSVGPQITAGSKDGLWEPVDEKIVDRSPLLVKGGDDYVGTYSFAGLMAWDPKRHPAGKHPVTFKDFWDGKTFPGRRGLRTRISETLEMALLADGVEPGKLYPLDIERGFKALDRVKPLVKKWIEATPETVTLLTAGEIDFTYTYASRVKPAQRAGTSIEASFEQTLNSLEYLAVPKHSKKKEAAMRYVAFCLRPDRQAAFADALSFAPNTHKGFELSSAEAKKFMPDMNKPTNAYVDDGWWANNYVNLQKRYTEWMIV